MATKKRIESLKEIINAILKAQKLGSGQAASLTGKLGFTTTACFGRFGRCRIKPISKRAYSRAVVLSVKLVVCLQWWLHLFDSFKPRPIPYSLSHLKIVVSYSDGEGGQAGVGAAIWFGGMRPSAVYTEVPLAVRQFWCRNSPSDRLNDIFMVEAVGPLLLCLLFPVSSARGCGCPSLTTLLRSRL